MRTTESSERISAFRSIWLLSVGGWRSKQDRGASTCAWHVPREGSHCCLAERKPRQSQKYLNTTKNAPKCQADVGTQVRWSILRFRTKAEHPSAPSGPTPWLSTAQCTGVQPFTQEGCGTVKVRAGFSQNPSERPDHWVILLCHWDKEENWVTEESGIIRGTWKSHFRDTSNGLNN